MSNVLWKQSGKNLNEPQAVFQGKAMFEPNLKGGLHAYQEDQGNRLGFRIQERGKEKRIWVIGQDLARLGLISESLWLEHRVP
jgi:hypothetical protein